MMGECGARNNWWMGQIGVDEWAGEGKKVSGISDQERQI